MVVISTVTRVKRVVPIDASETSKDALLTDILAAVSKEVESYIGYEVESKSRTERFHVAKGDEFVHLPVIPVTSVTSAKVSTAVPRDFSTALVAGTDYALRGGYEGLIYFEDSVLEVGRETLEVVYVAGLGVDTAAVIAAAPDLAHAVDLQTAEEFRRMSSPSTQVRQEPAGARTFTSAHGFLPRVVELLSRYRRVLLPSSTPVGVL